MATEKGLVYRQTAESSPVLSGQNDSHKVRSAYSPIASQKPSDPSDPSSYILLHRQPHILHWTGSNPFVLIKPNKSYPQRGMELGFAL